jgi:hypothetical protein
MSRAGRVLHLLRPNLSDVLALGTLLFVLLIRPQVTGYDVWWHLRTGLLLLGGEFPRQDPFSYTAAGAPWVLHGWLAEGIMAWLHQRGGETGLALLRAGAAAVTVGVVFTTCVRRGVDVLLSAALAAVLLLLTLHAWVLRPLVFTTFGLAVLLLLLDELRMRRRWWPAAAIPASMLLWVNLHGGFVLGLAVLGLVTGLEGVRYAARPARRTAENRRTLLASAVATFASAAAAAVNPHGLQALLYPLSYLGAGKAQHQTFIAEWLPPTWSDSAGFYVFAACTAVALGASWRRSSAVDVALVAVLFGLAASSRRHVALFVVASLPALAGALQALAARVRASLRGRADGLAERSSRVREIEAAPSVHLLGLVTVAVVAVVLLGGFLPRGAMRGGAGFPDETLSALRAAPEDAHVLAQYRWGGYLLWHLPDRPVFIDGRLDVYPRSVYEQYLDVAQLRPGWRAVLDRHDVRYILVQPDLPAATLPDVDPTWREVARDSASVLLAR